VTGESELLVARPSAGFEPFRADFADGCFLRSWDWPEVAPPDSFDRSVEAFKHMLSQGALRVAQDVEVGNASIVSSVRSALEARRDAILAERTFLESLSVPVKSAPDAPKPLRAPPIRSRSTPARSLAAKPAAAVEQGPDMAEFYEHILGLLRAVGRGMERSPGSFANADEETLRDHMLVTLNTRYWAAPTPRPSTAAARPISSSVSATSTRSSASASGGAARNASTTRSTNSSATQPGATASWRSSSMCASRT
jgi:hypothetical protein